MVHKISKYTYTYHVYYLFFLRLTTIEYARLRLLLVISTSRVNTKITSYKYMHKIPMNYYVPHLKNNISIGRTINAVYTSCGI